MAKRATEHSRKSSKREATGDEVMKRPPPTDWSLRPSRFEFDPKKAYSTEQLAEMGAISIKWNQVEAHIDFIATQILFAKVPIWLRFSIDRALRSRAKLDLLEECVTKAEFLNDAAKKAITETLFHVKTYNTYRNAVIHHSIYDHEKGIGSYVDESKKPFQIMVSLEALKNLYNLIDALLVEIREVDLLFRIETDAQRPGTTDRVTGDFKPYSISKLRDEYVPERAKELLRHQKHRNSLPQLPKFPDADLIRAEPAALEPNLKPAPNLKG